MSALFMSMKQISYVTFKKTSRYCTRAWPARRLPSQKNPPARMPFKVTAAYLMVEGYQALFQVGRSRQHERSFNLPSITSNAEH